MEKTIAVYIRLSNEDLYKNKSKKESHSIINQRNFIGNFIGQDTELSKMAIKEYCDDGYSGVDFNRPNIQRLLKDVEQGKIQCIITKDLSRFGRNYVLVGKYLEQILPLYDVRFIAIGDSYDSKKQNSNDSIVGFYNIAYAYYSKEISEKVTQGKRNAALKGYYSGSVAPYGYKKSKKDKHKLEKDETAANVVKQVFEMRIQGKNSREIAEYLNKEKIEPPSVYQSRKNNTVLNNITNKRWNGDYINRIIHNRCYLGIIENHKTHAPFLKTTKTTPKTEWICVSDMHEPLVSEEVFKQANATYQKKEKI